MPATPGLAQTVQSDDGLMTVDIPAGGLLQPTTMTATSRTQRDLPVELKGLEVRSAFHELAPADVVFQLPVTVTRRVRFSALDLDPQKGLPVLLLALRRSDGVWEWLADQRLERTDDEIFASGSALRTGSIFAFGGRVFTSIDGGGADPVPVGQSRRMSATLTFPDDTADPPLLGVFAPLFDASIVQLGDADGPDHQSLGQSFDCIAPGTATIGIRYSVLNIGADSVLFDQLGLGAASTEVTGTTSLTCESAATPSP